MTQSRNLLPWPENPLERLVLVELQVRRSVEPVSVGALGAEFDGATPEDVEQVLQMLMILRHVAEEGGRYRSLRR